MEAKRQRRARTRNDGARSLRKKRTTAPECCYGSGATSCSRKKQTSLQPAVSDWRDRITSFSRETGCSRQRCAGMNKSIGRHGDRQVRAPLPDPPAQASAQPAFKDASCKPVIVARPSTSPDWQDSSHDTRRDLRSHSACRRGNSLSVCRTTRRPPRRAPENPDAVRASTRATLLAIWTRLTA